MRADTDLCMYMRVRSESRQNDRFPARNASPIILCQCVTREDINSTYFYMVKSSRHACTKNALLLRVRLETLHLRTHTMTRIRTLPTKRDKNLARCSLARVLCSCKIQKNDPSQYCFSLQEKEKKIKIKIAREKDRG